MKRKKKSKREAICKCPTCGHVKYGGFTTATATYGGEGIGFRFLGQKVTGTMPKKIITNARIR